MKLWIKSFSLLCFSLMAMACAHNEQAQPHTMPVATATQSPVYDANSWKGIIPQGCSHFSDGCNTCTRVPGAEVAACTRKACVQYKKPECLEKEKSVFVCSGQKTFTVFYKEYLSGDQKVALKPDQIMLVDSQTQTASSLTREPSASGSKYSGGGLSFWEKGDEAMLLLRGEPLYEACTKR